MNPTRRRATTLVALTLMAPALRAQAPYPNRPIQLIHGFGAGGNADVVGRLIGQKLAEQMGVPVVVDIKSGAGGTIASNIVAKASPDGYTLVMLTGAHTVSAALKHSLPYDSIKDFAFVSQVSSFPFVVAVRAEHPAKTLAQLLDLARRDPGKVSFTSVGVGSTQHMVGELLASSANVQLLHIPYRGGGAPVQAVIGGDVDILADTLTVATPHIQSGRLRALAVTSASEWPSLPGVPPVSATLPGFEIRSWLGIAAPAGTPGPIVERLNSEIAKALAAPDVKTLLAGAGSEPAPTSPAVFAQRVTDEIGRWKKVIAQRGIVTE